MPDVSATTVPAKKPVSPITWGPAAAIAVTVVIYFASQLFGGLIIFLAATLKGIDPSQFNTWVDQVGPQFFFILMVEGFGIGALALFLKTQKASLKILGLTKPHWKDLAWVFIGFAIYMPLLIAIMAAVKTWFPQINLEQQQQIGFQGAQGMTLIPVFISLVILPPIAEELMTRGFLFLGLASKLPVITAALITSALFAVAHLQAGSGAPLLWTAAIDTFLLSMVLILLRQKTGRLWSSIGLHVLKNTIAFLTLFIFIS